MKKLRWFTNTFVASVMLLTGFTAVPALSAQSARDCDDNAIIRCGVRDLDELKQKYRENQAGNVKAVFQHFGIGSEGAMDGMVSGRITRSNEVYAGNTLVATNAMTAGRQNMPGSTAILNGAAYERPPSVSFNSNSLLALVKMEGGQFKFAVIMSCGNPVKATPKPPEQPPASPPRVSIRKDVRVHSQTDWKDSVRLGANQTAEFRIIVRNTGNVAIPSYVVGDKLPAGVTIAANSMTLNGQPNNDTASFTQNGIIINQAFQPNTEVTIVFKATLNGNNETSHVRSRTVAVNSERNSENHNEFNDRRSQNTNDQECRTERYRNVAYVRVPNLPEREDDAHVTVEICEELPKPAPAVTPAGMQPAQTPPPAVLPATGVASVAGVFTLTSLLGAAVHKLKDFYLIILNK